MKKALTLSLLALALIAAPAMADMEGSALKHIFLMVAPDVAVGADTDSSVDAGEIQRGEVIVDIPFRVDANKEHLQLYVTATPLFKGDDPTNNDVTPVDLCGWVEILPDNANPFAGASTMVGPSNSTFIGDFPATRFETIDFESSQNGHFSQDVTVTVCWDQDEFEKPMGEYSGYVKLTALLFDNSCSGPFCDPS